MKRYCYICGYETNDENIIECPQCLCDDVFVSSEEEEELMKLSNDRKFTNAMIKLHDEDPIEYQLKISQFKANLKQQESSTKKVEEDNNTPHCPYCNSTNIKKITTGSKVAHTALFGIFSMSRNSKQWHCNNCKSDF